MPEEGLTTDTTLLGEGNEGMPDGTSEKLGWRAGLPTELQHHEWLKDFTKVGDFATAAIEVKERMDKAITPPGENATEDERKAYLKALGVPESSDGYTFDLSKIPKDLELNEEIVTWLRGVAHKNNLTQPQAEAMLVEMATRVTDQLKQQGAVDEQQAQEAEQQKKKALQGLKDEWKEEFDTRLARVHKTAMSLFGQEFIDHAEATDIGNDLYVLRMLDILGQVQLPDTLLKGTQINTTEANKDGLSYPWMRDFYGKNQSE